MRQLQHVEFTERMKNATSYNDNFPQDVTYRDTNADGFSECINSDTINTLFNHLTRQTPAGKPSLIISLPLPHYGKTPPPQ